MKIVKLLVLILAALLVFAGCFFVAQSLNIIQWPSDSFMVNNSSWSWKGSLYVVAGLVLAWWARRK